MDLKRILHIAKSALMPVGAFVLGSLFGPGFVWQWKHADVERQKQIAELRKDELAEYDQFANLANECFEAQRSPTSSAKLAQCQTKMWLVGDNFGNTEAVLARLEGRAVRHIPLFNPAIQPPSNLGAVGRE